MTVEKRPPPWHALLAAVPADAVLRRRRVLDPATHPGAVEAGIADWEELVVELSAAAAGLRVILVTLDADGRPIMASDLVLHRRMITVEGSLPAIGPVEVRQESIGGRFETDGGFRGTRWTAVGIEPADGGEVRWQMTPSTPAEAEVSALAALVRDLIARPSSRV